MFKLYRLTVTLIRSCFFHLNAHFWLKELILTKEIIFYQTSIWNQKVHIGATIWFVTKITLVLLVAFHQLLLYVGMFTTSIRNKPHLRRRQTLLRDTGGMKVFRVSPHLRHRPPILGKCFSLHGNIIIHAMIKVVFKNTKLSSNNNKIHSNIQLYWPSWPPPPQKGDCSIIYWKVN